MGSLEEYLITEIANITWDDLIQIKAFIFTEKSLARIIDLLTIKTFYSFQEHWFISSLEINQYLPTTFEVIHTFTQNLLTAFLKYLDENYSQEVEILTKLRLQIDDQQLIKRCLITYF